MDVDLLFIQQKEEIALLGIGVANHVEFVVDLLLLAVLTDMEAETLLPFEVNRVKGQAEAQGKRVRQNHVEYSG